MTSLGALVLSSSWLPPTNAAVCWPTPLSCLFRRQAEDEAATLTLRADSAAPQRAHQDCSRCLPNQASWIVFVPIKSISDGCINRSPADLSGRSLFHNKAALRATNAILQIRTAVRRFLTRARRSIRTPELCPT